MDFTGCGNTPEHAAPARAATDHGQPALLGARRCTSTGSGSTSPAPWPANSFEVNKLGAFFDIIHQDPVLTQVKLIAEPWDVGPGGYQVGNFPLGLDRVERQVPRQRPRVLEGRRRRRRASSPRGSPAPATCTSGAAASRTRASTSSPATTGSRSTTWSATTQKHNEANGEDNRDGHDDNNARWNCGAEGPTDDPKVHRPPRAAEAEPDRHAAALAGRADAPRRRRARPHAAREQQHLLPGQRADVAELGAGRRAEAFLAFVADGRRASGASSRCCSGGRSSRAGRSAARA